MIEDNWFDAKVKDKKKDCITIEVKVEADHVWDVENAVIDRVLEIIDKRIKDLDGRIPTVRFAYQSLRKDVEKLRGSGPESKKEEGHAGRGDADMPILPYNAAETAV